MLKRFLCLEKWPTAHNSDNLPHYRGGTNDKTCQSSGWNRLPISLEEETREHAGGSLYYLSRGLFLRKLDLEPETGALNAGMVIDALLLRAVLDV